MPSKKKKKEWENRRKRLLLVMCLNNFTEFLPMCCNTFQFTDFMFFFYKICHWVFISCFQNFFPSGFFSSCKLSPLIISPSRSAFQRISIFHTQIRLSKERRNNYTSSCAVILDLPKENLEVSDWLFSPKSHRETFFYFVVWPIRNNMTSLEI